MWYLYYGVGATPSDARRDSIDHMRQQQVDLHPDANDDGTQYEEHTDQVSIVSTVTQDPNQSNAVVSVDSTTSTVSTTPNEKGDPPRSTTTTCPNADADSAHHEQAYNLQGPGRQSDVSGIPPRAGSGRASIPYAVPRGLDTGPAPSPQW
eukprot:COSAG01_NODE_26077_length_724_cov_0.985600_1_plen_150_part_00